MPRRRLTFGSATYSTHDAANINLVVEAVADRSEENDAVAKFDAYAALGVRHSWVVRGDVEAEEIDGMITMYVLRDGIDEVAGHRLVSKL
jgi:hypothetical protein